MPGDLDTCVLDVLQGTFPSTYSGIINGDIAITEDYLTADMYNTVNPGTTVPPFDTIFKVVNFGTDSGFVVYFMDYGIVALTNNGHLNISDYVHPTYKEPDEPFDPRDEIFSLIDRSAYFRIEYDSIIRNDVPDTTHHYGPFTDVITSKDSLRETNGPYVLLNLNQGYPINKYCMSCSNGGRGSDSGYVDAGCGPVALAMIFSYYNSPNTVRDSYVDWDSVIAACPKYPKSYNLNVMDKVAKYVDRLGVIGWKASSCALGTAVSSGGMSTTMACYGSYHNVHWESIKYHGNDYIYKIKKGAPVIMYSYEDGKSIASSHYFVIDGFGDIERGKERRYQDGYIEKKTDILYTLVHCNWGWGGKYNGYYRYENGFDLSNGPDVLSLKVTDSISCANSRYSKYRKVLMYNFY